LIFPTNSQRLSLPRRVRAASPRSNTPGKVLENDIAPEWLQKSWESSRQAGLDQLSGEEIDAEIAAARKARREAPTQPGS